MPWRSRTTSRTPIKPQTMPASLRQVIRSPGMYQWANSRTTKGMRLLIKTQWEAVVCVNPR